jgi:hypothetical protein
MSLRDTSHRKLMLSTGVGAACLIVVLLLVLVVTLLRYRKLICKRPSPTAVEFQQPKKRVVVVMHSNSLYQNSSTKDSGSLPLLLPLVRIEGGKGRLSSEFISVSDYEIPLDREWEFPREK